MFSTALPNGPLTSARSSSATTVDVVADDQSWTLHTEWLRDNCRCDLCRVVQTDERRFQPWRTAAPAVVTAEAVDGELVIDWADGHHSVFTPNDFEALAVAVARGRHQPKLWRAGHDVQRVDHDRALADPAARRAMLEALRDDGVVVVTGSPTTPGSIIQTCRQLAIALVDSSLGFLFDVKVDPSGFNVAFTAEELAPHNDNAQYRYPPSGQALAMLANDASGGDSVVVDGFSVMEELEALDPEALEVLSRVRVGFRQYSTTADNLWRSPVVVRDADGGYARLRFSNALRQPLDPQHPDLAEWYRAYRLLGTLVCDQRFAVSFRLEAGHTLFVHGDRVLHARKAFTPDGPRHLQDVFFNIDDVFGQLDRLTGMAPDAMWTSAEAKLG